MKKQNNLNKCGNFQKSGLDHQFFPVLYLNTFFLETGSYYVDQANLELRDPPASASGELGLKEYTTTAQFNTSCFCFVLFCLDRFFCVALAILELNLETRLAWNSEFCLPLPP